MEIAQLKEKVTKLERKDRAVPHVPVNFVQTQIIQPPSVKPSDAVALRGFLQKHGLARYSCNFESNQVRTIKDLLKYSAAEYETLFKMKRGHSRKCELALETHVRHLDSGS